MKVVINKCYGGFGLSHKATMRYAEIKGIRLFPFIERQLGAGKYVEYEEGQDAFLIYYSTKSLKNGQPKDRASFRGDDIKRDDPALIQVIEELKEEADGFCAELGIVEIPDGVEWVIEEYDGTEWVSEAHQTWG